MRELHLDESPNMTTSRLSVAIKMSWLALTIILCGCATKNPAVASDDLVFAVKLGDVVEINRLLDNGADVNSQNKNGITPLIAAAFYGNLEVAKILLARGAVVNMYGASDDPALVAAIMQDQKRMADFLINNGADVNIKLRDGTSPLHVAVLQGSTDMVALLIEDGADINAKDKDGQTPLDDSVISQNQDMVKLLVAKGAEINAQDKAYIDSAGLVNTPTNVVIKKVATAKKRRHRHRPELRKAKLEFPAKNMPGQLKKTME
jgi:ankyrin repeat protein